MRVLISFVAILYAVHTSFHITFDRRPFELVSVSPSTVVRIKTIRDEQRSTLISKIYKYITHKGKYWLHKGEDYIKDRIWNKRHYVNSETVLKSNLPTEVKLNYANSLKHPKQKSKYFALSIKSHPSISSNRQEGTLEGEEKTIIASTYESKGNRLTKLAGEVDRLKSPTPPKRYAKLHITPPKK